MKTSKNEQLTEAEFQLFRFSARTLLYIEEFCRKSGLKEGAINSLDWGCGRWRYVG